MSIRRKAGLAVSALTLAGAGLAMAAPAHAIQQVTCPTAGLNVYSDIWSAKDTCYAGSVGSASVWIPNAFGAYSQVNNYSVTYITNGQAVTAVRVAGESTTIPNADVTRVAIR